MAATPSTMTDLGSAAPGFSLTDTDGRTVSAEDFAGKSALLVMFVCNHCPFVVHVQEELSKIGSEYGDRAGIVAINSNDVDNYPDDAPDKMKAKRAEWNWSFPYLYDETQSVAQAYRAACTPDFFLYDAERKLAYRGQLDGSRPNNDEPVTGADLRAALDAVLGGQRVPSEQRPSIGCNIKWKPGTAAP